MNLPDGKLYHTGTRSILRSIRLGLCASREGGLDGVLCGAVLGLAVLSGWRRRDTDR